MAENNLIKFKKNEIKDLNEALIRVLDNIRELWAISPYTQIDIPFDLYNIGCEDWILRINDRNLMFFLKNGRGCVNGYHKIFLEVPSVTKKNNRLKIRDDEILADQVFRFLAKYETIREKIEETIQSGLEEKNQAIKVIHDIKSKYDKETTIELEFPKTQNIPSLELKKKDGQTIGEIKLGSGIVRIINKGPIIISQNEEMSEKIKTK